MGRLAKHGPLGHIKELAFLYAELEKLQLRTHPTQANFFLIDVEHDGRKVYEAMLRRGVIVRAMNSYGLDNYIRISVGRPEENQRFVESLKEVLAELESADDTV